MLEKLLMCWCRFGVFCCVHKCFANGEYPVEEVTSWGKQDARANIDKNLNVEDSGSKEKEGKIS